MACVIIFIMNNNSCEVYSIGEIDKEIYKCITEDIVTKSVVITANQIQHIQERHPADFERFSACFEEIVTEPDYIIETNKENTLQTRIS